MTTGRWAVCGAAAVLLLWMCVRLCVRKVHPQVAVKRRYALRGSLCRVSRERGNVK